MEVLECAKAQKFFKRFAQKRRKDFISDKIVCRSILRKLKILELVLAMYKFDSVKFFAP
jgi:hypothetical protein